MSLSLLGDAHVHMIKAICHGHLDNYKLYDYNGSTILLSLESLSQNENTDSRQLLGGFLTLLHAQSFAHQWTN